MANSWRTKTKNKRGTKNYNHQVTQADSSFTEVAHFFFFYFDINEHQSSWQLITTTTKKNDAAKRRIGRLRNTFHCISTKRKILSSGTVNKSIKMPPYTVSIKCYLLYANRSRSYITIYIIY